MLDRQVGFTPNSRHPKRPAACPKSANRRHKIRRRPPTEATLLVDPLSLPSMEATIRGKLSGAWLEPQWLFHLLHEIGAHPRSLYLTTHKKCDHNNCAKCAAGHKNKESPVRRGHDLLGLRRLCLLHFLLSSAGSISVPSDVDAGRSHWVLACNRAL